MTTGPLEAIMARWAEAHPRADVTTRYAVEKAHERTLAQLDATGWEVVPEPMVAGLLENLEQYHIDGPITVDTLGRGSSAWTLDPPVRLTEDHTAWPFGYGDLFGLLVQEPDGKMVIHWATSEARPA